MTSHLVYCFCPKHVIGADAEMLRGLGDIEDGSDQLFWLGWIVVQIEQQGRHHGASRISSACCHDLVDPISLELT
jgi:hypothetical protein